MFHGFRIPILSSLALWAIHHVSIAQTPLMLSPRARLEFIGHGRTRHGRCGAPRWQARNASRLSEDLSHRRLQAA